jgi:hypothetical protein
VARDDRCQFEDLGVGEMLSQAFERSVVDREVIKREFFTVFDR